VSRYEFAAELMRLLARRFGEHAARALRVVAVTSDEFKTSAPRPANSALATGKLKLKFGLELRPWQHDLAEFVLTSPDAAWQ
jgi:dTDP-4-dehydrorhamnose reductase